MVDVRVIGLDCLMNVFLVFVLIKLMNSFGLIFKCYMLIRQ